MANIARCMKPNTIKINRFTKFTTLFQIMWYNILDLIRGVL
ncbi:unknown [Firmicutes bacterium CAG:313]|nr:unknown [Firmicutes bacterium CAG:313]